MAAPQPEKVGGLQGFIASTRMSKAEGRQVETASITGVEVVAAIIKRVRMNEVSRPDADAGLADFKLDLS